VLHRSAPTGTDRRTQRAFFAQPWQVGLCVDPVRHEDAWFRGAESMPDGTRVIVANRSMPPARTA